MINLFRDNEWCHVGRKWWGKAIDHRIHQDASRALSLVNGIAFPLSRNDYLRPSIWPNSVKPTEYYIDKKFISINSGCPSPLSLVVHPSARTSLLMPRCTLWGPSEINDVMVV
jgi:hypothetical protein